jgi:hypothetical protein
MNKITTLAAIAMFAVVMGLSSFAPAALASSNDNHGKTTICHFDFNDGVWEADKEVNPHALTAHLGHDDQIILNDDQPEGTITVDECLAQEPLPPKEV